MPIAAPESVPLPIPVQLDTARGSLVRHSLISGRCSALAPTLFEHITNPVGL
jgi:hypothetical protein